MTAGPVRGGENASPSGTVAGDRSAARPAPPPAPPGRRPAGGPTWRTRFRRLLPYVAVGGAGFLLAYLAVYFFVFPSRLVPDDRPIPDVVGMPVDAATRRLSDAGFLPQVGEQRINMSVPPFTVVKQTPAATTVKPRQTTVVIDIAVGK